VRTDLVDIALALIVLFAFLLVWRKEGDDPVWQERWRALSPADRTRIARAARSGALLSSQEEIELAAGYARRDQRRRLPYTLMTGIRLPLGIALLAGGLLAGALDITYACLFWAIKADMPPTRIFQSVAAGLLGKASFEGGAATAALGLSLHFFIACTMALTYYFVSRRWTVLVRRPVPLGIAYGLESMRSPAGLSIVPTPGWGFRLLTMVTLTAGTALIMWMGELISQRGIGNGMSMIIFASVVSSLPLNFLRIWEEESKILFVLLLALVAGIVFAVVRIELGT